MSWGNGNNVDTFLKTLIFKKTRYGNVPSGQSLIGKNHDIIIFLALQKLFRKLLNNGSVALKSFALNVNFKSLHSNKTKRISALILKFNK